jgi:hypothetical protein
MNEILPFERSKKLAFVPDFYIIQLFFLFFSTAVSAQLNVIKKNKHSNYFIAVPLPLRFGNEKEPSFTAAFQFGIGL